VLFPTYSRVPANLLSVARRNDVNKAVLKNTAGNANPAIDPEAERILKRRRPTPNHS